MIFFRYLTRLFWMRFLSIQLGALLMVVLFEWLTLTGPYRNILVKIPFTAHKLLPFIIFITMISFIWSLMGRNEWNALSSIGRSPWHILRTPLIWVILLGVLDMWVIVPMGQPFFNPFEQKISLFSRTWKKGVTKDGYVFFNPDGPKYHILEMQKNSVLRRHIFGRTLHIQGTELICRDLWSMQAHRCPEKQAVARITLSKPVHLDQTESHPLGLSLGGAYSAMGKNPQGSLLLSARIHYWYSHFFWSLSLVFLAPALLIGADGYRKIFGTIFGLLGVLMVYLIKEWLYALSIPLAHSWPVMLLWLPFFMTVGLTWVLFFEKREL
jgi:hypothetical protein